MLYNVKLFTPYIIEPAALTQMFHVFVIAFFFISYICIPNTIPEEVLSTSSLS